MQYAPARHCGAAPTPHTRAPPMQGAPAGHGGAAPTPHRRAGPGAFGPKRHRPPPRLDGMAATTPRRIDRQRIKELTEREEARLNERTPQSHAMYKRAQNVLSGGVASSYQLRDPWPIYLERGDGPRVWDVDGNELFDFHNGF